MMDIWQEPEDYSRIIHVSEDGTTQIRLTVNTFRGVEYMHLRKYYQSFVHIHLQKKKYVYQIDFRQLQIVFRLLNLLKDFHQN